ncbi:MAG: hypothetical protein D6730_16745 [Bacteroidetes bacterium]|nr:MAG: hypothetical protein D6730_16745 [Bacteroidota bacterium]
MKRLFALFTAMMCLGALAQPSELASYNSRHLRIQKGAMWTLGGWAVLNIGGGLIARSQSSGSTRYFHEMNALWNTVNLGIALPSLIGAYQTDLTQISRSDALKRQHAIERILMLNIGLNTGYIMTGAFLIERSRRGDTDWKPERLKGYGQSLLLQGGFLLLFDVTQYLLYQQNGKRVMPALLGQVRVTGNGVGVCWVF